MGHEQEPDACIEQPGRCLPDHVHFQLVALRCKRLVAGEEQDVPAENHDQPGERHVVGQVEQDHRSVDHQPVRQRIEDPAELGLDVPAPGEEAVDLVGDARDPEDDPGGPAVAVLDAEHQRDEHGYENQPRDRQRVREQLERRGHDAGRHRCGKDTPVAETLSLPGFVDAHCHGFQRALRGRGGGADFWAWRELMLAEAELQTPDAVRRGYVDVYRELRAAGYTAVGEFHYLGYGEALAATEAAEEAGIRIVLLLAAYERGGLPRFRQASVTDYLGQVEALRGRGVAVGLAPHSVRAVTASWLEEIGRYAVAEELPLHVHADEQPCEIEECVAEHGVRPIELLARTGCLSKRTTVVHATHADGAELDLLAQAGARICACPTTEANLGDGFLPVERLLHRGIGICIGSDSNVRIDPFEELRELDGIARRQAGRRDVLTVDALLSMGSDEGAASIGLEEWPQIEIDADHPQLRGVDEPLCALIAGCSADVVV